MSGTQSHDGLLCNISNLHSLRGGGGGGIKFKSLIFIYPYKEYAVGIQDVVAIEFVFLIFFCHHIYSKTTLQWQFFLIILYIFSHHIYTIPLSKKNSLENQCYCIYGSLH